MKEVWKQFEKTPNKYWTNADIILNKSWNIYLNLNKKRIKYRKIHEILKNYHEHIGGN